MMLPAGHQETLAIADLLLANLAVIGVQLWSLVSCAAWPAGHIGHDGNRRVEELFAQARTAPDAAATVNMVIGFIPFLFMLRVF